MLHHKTLYFFSFASALVISLVLTPAARAAALLFNILDHPSSPVKTHREPVPYLGGVAIFISFVFSLLFVRVLFNFPSGTLRSLRGIILGGGFVFLMGLVDDIKPMGLHYRTKFMFQISSAVLLMIFGIQIRFVQPVWLGFAITLVWVVGVTNAFNIIDIMDGLSSGIAFVACLFFLFVALPSEDFYVNFAAASLAGATLGFFPYNTSKKMRIFMGDCGSLFIGFVTCSLAMGTSYSSKNQWGVLAPLFILMPPIYDTLLVFYLRTRKGMSPFLGSKDHFALRLEKLGWNRKNILLFTLFSTVACGFLAYGLTQCEFEPAVGIILFFLTALTVFTAYILKAKI